MSRFLQLHYLTVYPLSNPNRDDTGRPKSAVYGGAPRLRLSSQSLKRAARIHDVFQRRLQGHLGARTQRIGQVVLDHLDGRGLSEAKAQEIAEKITDVFGKIDAGVKKKDPSDIRTRQLAFVSPQERRRALELADQAAEGEPLPELKELKKEVLRKADGAVDIAMFGRMLADDPDFNREAAAQVAHAVTTHRAVVEDDYYTAVDDLKTSAEDAGAGFIGDAGFGSGVYYLYVCVDRALLIRNLDGDADLAVKACEALAEAFALASPGGKRTSFAHNPRAEYILAERGDQQPRTLAGAFLKPVADADLLGASIKALECARARMETAYGRCAEDYKVMNVADGDGALDDIVAFAGDGVRHA